MGKSFIIIALVAAFVSSTIAAPIFVRSSNKIQGFEQDLFMNADQFTSALEKSFLAKEKSPNNVFVFNVQITDPIYIENPRLLLKEINKRNVLREHFGNPEFAISSSYIQSGFSEEFHNKIIKTANKNNYHVIHSDLKSFDFKGTSHAVKSKGKVIDVIDIGMDQLKALDNVFRMHLKEFDRVSSRNNIMLLKFTDATKEDSSILSLVQRNEETFNKYEDSRVLAEVGDDKYVSTFPITPDGFFGYLITIILMIFCYWANLILNDIKTPKSFYDRPLHVGKEH